MPCWSYRFSRYEKGIIKDVAGLLTSPFFCILLRKFWILLYNYEYQNKTKKDDRPCIVDSRLFIIWEKIIMNWFVTWFSSQYMKNFCVAGKIGIGVILYEKGKGKFVGDWKTHHTEIVNKLKEILFSFMLRSPLTEQFWAMTWMWCVLKLTH